MENIQTDQFSYYSQNIPKGSKTFTAHWSDCRVSQKEHFTPTKFTQKVVGKIVLPGVWRKAKPAQKRLQEKLKSSKWWRTEIKEVNSLKLTTPDGVALDAIEGIHESQLNKKPSEQKWIIIFNANGNLYEYETATMMAYACEVNANILLFNYRGFGGSEGTPTRFNDLLLDGETCILYLFSQGVESENILFRGHSMGGAVSLKLRALYPEGPIVRDRSFSSLNETVKSLYGTLAANLVKEAHWEIDVTEAWDKVLGDKIIVYHTEDQMIDYEKASLETYLTTHPKEDEAHLKNSEDLELNILSYFPEYSAKEMEIRELKDSSHHITHIGLHVTKVGKEKFDPHNDFLEFYPPLKVAIYLASKQALHIS